jgi:acyl-CoA synthetase (AMP-forming)/AMP-acid ligase II/3-hydroxymyristoyl/3-hydroxydecanoyl-(acyl carrier protein) dehydratase
MHAESLSLARVALDNGIDCPVAWHDGQIRNRQSFCSEAARYTALLLPQTQQRYALYCQGAYPFAVLLFALFHAGKEVWIPGNNKPATAEQLLDLDCQLLGEWDGEEILPDTSPRSEAILKPLDLAEVQLYIFTSGSSGKPKAIAKTLLQLQLEITELERQWGQRLGRAQAVATVSHQHIYGLLFRLLWPLATGRCFHSPMYLSPEPMLKAVQKTSAYWVASPAQLKRLDEDTDWDEIARLALIFSSGGPLSQETARRIEHRSGRTVVEIYGSSETGGIAWRQASIEAAWTPFAGIELTPGPERCLLRSPFLPGTEPYPLDDAVIFHADGRFMLSGRLDRIVKVEEKRLSLDELEQALRQSDWVAESHCLLLKDGRDRIAAAIVLTEKGWAALERQGRAALTASLRKQLMQAFDAVVLPRKWLFMNMLPLTPQGKIDNVLLLKLMRLDRSKFPRLLSCRFENHTVRLELRARRELIYFEGHFPEQPILPGVAQLAWVEAYGKILFGIEQPFLTMEVVKFKKIIQPEALLTLTLEWKETNGKLYFELNSGSDMHSSGRMVYGARP